MPPSKHFKPHAQGLRPCPPSACLTSHRQLVSYYSAPYDEPCLLKVSSLSTQVTLGPLPNSLMKTQWRVEEEGKGTSLHNKKREQKEKQEFTA